MAISASPEPPGGEYQPDGIACARCAHYVGARSSCPNCGAAAHRRMPLKVFRITALALALGGLLLLYLAARLGEPPLIRADDIGPTMNFAAVRVEGTVTGAPRVFRRNGAVQSLRFTLHDGSGELPVVIYRRQAQRLLDSGKLPLPGDRVTAGGNLNVSAADQPLLRISAAEQLHLERASLTRTPLGELGPEDAGRAVLAAGRVISVHPPAAGSRRPWTLLLDDGSGRLPLVFWEDVAAALPQPPCSLAGRDVSARCTVNIYRGRPQLLLPVAAGLQPRESPGGKPAAAHRAKEVTSAWTGRTVRVRGKVLRTEPPRSARGPWTTYLATGERQPLEVAYWGETAARIGRLPESGDLLTVYGRVGEYRSRLQLVVEDPGGWQLEEGSGDER